MISLVLISILSIYYYSIVNKDINKSVYYFLPYNYIFDLLIFTTDPQISAYGISIRAIILIIVFKKILGTKFVFIPKASFRAFAALIIILSLSSIFSDSVAKSLSETLKFSLILFSYFVFIIHFTFYDINIKRLNFMIIAMLAITIINIALSNIFSFGWEGYGENVRFYTGGILSNMWYVPAFALVGSIALQYLKNKEKNITLNIFSVIVVVILIIALRRSAYIIIIIGALCSLTFLKLQAKTAKKLLISGALLLLTSPFALPLLEKQFEARTKTLDKGIEEESRVKETDEVWDERFNSSPLEIFLFGEKAFNTAGNYANGKFAERPLHVDFNIIFFSGGIVGLIIYAIFMSNIFINFLRLSHIVKRYYIEHKVFKFIFYSFYLSIIALSFSSGLNAITFRMFGFFMIAMASGHLTFLKQLKKRQNRTLETSLISNDEFN